MKKLWQQYTEEEIRTMINESTTLMEVVIKLGYKADQHRYKQVREAADFYNISIEHLKTREGKKPENLIGQKFHMLKVIDYGKRTAANQITYLCQCDCGNIITVQQNNLKNGHTKSCGCIKKGKMLAKDLTGQKFGFLTVVERDCSKPRGEGQPAYWLCRCDCGNPNLVSVRGYNLTHDITHSCGCLYQNIKSWGEITIENYLKEKQINYISEYYFPDLIGVQKPLRFDFAIFKDSKLIALIEYQGEQHYKKIDFFGQRGYEITQKNDELKLSYCNKNKIPLYYISYDQNTITELKNILIKEKLLDNC